jgi:Holliday junction resolvase RusA-like endonuclease
MKVLVAREAPAGSAWKEILNVWVPGIPRPGGSKLASVVFNRAGQIVRTKTGRPLVTVRDMGGENTRNWRAVVADCVGQAWAGRPLLDEPIKIKHYFMFPRPASHYGIGRNSGALKAGAPPYPAVAPDYGKLARSTDDAMTGVLYKDDSRIVIASTGKFYGDKPGCTIEVAVLNRNSAELPDSPATGNRPVGKQSLPCPPAATLRLQGMSNTGGIVGDAASADSDPVSQVIRRSETALRQDPGGASPSGHTTTATESTPACADRVEVGAGNVGEKGLKNVEKELRIMAGLGLSPEEGKHDAVANVMAQGPARGGQSGATDAGARDNGGRNPSAASILTRHRNRLGESIYRALLKAKIIVSENNALKVLAELNGGKSPHHALMNANLADLIDWDDKLRRTTIARLREIVSGTEASA